MKKTVTCVIIITAVGFAFSGIFYAFNKNGKESVLSDALEKATIPVQSILSRGENIVYNLKNKDSYMEENKKLKYENGRLRYEIRKAESLKKENLRLRGLLELSQNNRKFDMVACEVVGMSERNESIVYKINKGTKDGIKLNDVAILNYTLIGKIFAAGENWAKILPVISPESAVGVVSCESEVSAVAEGNEELLKGGQLILSHISEKDKLIKGEQIQTFGGGSLFPEGLLVGTVSEVLKNGAIIDTNIDFNSISEVMIIRRGQE